MLYFVIDNCTLIVAYLNYLWGIKILDIKLALKLSLAGMDNELIPHWGLKYFFHLCINKGGLEQV